MPVPRVIVTGPAMAAGSGGAGPPVQRTALQPPVPRPARVIVKLRPPATASATSVAAGASIPAAGTTIESKLQALLAKHALPAAVPLSPGHVRARQQAAGSRLKAAARPRFAARAARAPAGAVVPDFSSTYVLNVGHRSTIDMAAMLQALRADPDVLYAEEDRVVSAFYVPNDPSYSSSNSWGQGYDDLHGLKRIGTTAAWDVTKGQGIVVAVIDTGIDYHHPDISANIWINAGEIPGNGLDDDGNGFIDDVRGWDFVGVTQFSPIEDNDPYDGHFHGTHVAGTIAATGDNNLGVVGVAWQAKVMALKGLDDQGFGFDSGLAQAILYAVDNGADVINASWGGGGAAQAITDAIDYAYASGVVFVVAAGNSNVDTAGFYPANVSTAIAVSALNPDDTLAGFSNFGSKIEVSAPGVEILSLKNATGDYFRLAGTSMAAPHVSGVVALILAQHPAYSIEQVRQALRISATDLGPAGKDASFGYGRVNAAQAVLVDHPLAAKILSPLEGVRVAGPVPLRGTAGGPDFDHYIVDYGAGSSPVSWTVIRNSSTSVADGDIGTFDPASLPDGSYAVRLRAFDSNGTAFEDQTRIEVRYLELTAPKPPRVPSLVLEVKPGMVMQVTGSARGGSFQGYALEWAPGIAATSGWSATGVALAGGGLSPVTEGNLGAWTTPAGLDGYYTLRLTVTNAGFSSTATTTVYFEPALAANAWPQFVPAIAQGKGAVPVRRPDGTTRLALCSTIAPQLLYLFAPDGSVSTAPLGIGSMVQPVAANLDGQPGDEIVIPAGPELRIYSSDLTLLRTIPSGEDWFFGFYQVTLADLDNDGIPEIILPTANIAVPEIVGEIRAYRFDGTAFFAAPPQYTTRWAAGADVRLVVVDLNQDGQKEIIVTCDNPEPSPAAYTIAVYNADGTPFAGWGPVVFTGQTLESFQAADLDQDGTCELVLTDRDPLTNAIRCMVLNHTGTIRPGWPHAITEATFESGASIGDLDGDGKREILVVTHKTLTILRDNGTLWGGPWEIDINGAHLSVPLVADTDDDGVPEILMALGRLTLDPATGLFRDSTLVSYSPAGVRLRSWPLFGREGEQPFRAVPLVGDFNGDGQTDLVVNITLVAGGGSDGWTDNSCLTYLTTGTRFNAGASDWTSNFHDPQNSRTLVDIPPAIANQPASRTLATGQGTSFVVYATGAEPLAFRWQRFPAGGASWSNLSEGGNYSGTATSNLLLTGATPAMSGDQFRCEVYNNVGLVVSNTATLTVVAGYATWRESEFTAGELSDANISGPNADPDHDGFANFMEYALGLEPKSVSTAGLPQVGTQGSDWVYTYTRPADSADVTYVVEVSVNLTDWGTAGVTHEQVSSSGGSETWRAKYPLASADNLFFRLKVTGQ